MELTAVEWLEMEIVKLENTYAIPHEIYVLCEQAKVMDEKNIKNAWVNGYNCRTSEDLIGGTGNEENEYYNETFKKS